MDINDPHTDWDQAATDLAMQAKEDEPKKPGLEVGAYSHSEFKEAEV